MLGWSLFSDLVNRCLTLFIDNGNLLKKMLFPRICLPIIAGGVGAAQQPSAASSRCSSCSRCFGRFPGPGIVWVPVLMLLTLAMGLSVGLLLGVFNVFVRDVGQVVPVVLQFGFWLAPIAYTPDIVPAPLRRLLYLNPMTRDRRGLPERAAVRPRARRGRAGLAGADFTAPAGRCPGDVPPRQSRDGRRAVSAPAAPRRSPRRCGAQRLERDRQATYERADLVGGRPGQGVPRISVGVAASCSPGAACASRRVAEQWALRDVSFDVAAGSAVGIVGQNGAGKSTLLKLIAGTLRATRGDVHVDGPDRGDPRAGHGLQSGVHRPAECRCMRSGSWDSAPASIAAAMPEIEAFAEIGDYFDQPMRTYSSGMQMRVAFAVATAFRPDVLIIDEALSVGDAYFQHKSFGRIRAFKEQGTALLFVTHGMADIRALCDRVILLDRGSVLRDGLPDEVVDYYNALIARKENERDAVEQSRGKDGWLRTRSGTGEAVLDELALSDAQSGESVRTARVGQRLVLTARARVHSSLPRLVLGYMLRDRLGHVVWGTNTWHTGQVQDDVAAGAIVVFRLSFTCTLGPGSYSFSPALVSSDTHLANNYEWTDNALVFDVVNAEHTYFIGSNWLDAAFDISREAGA